MSNGSYFPMQPPLQAYAAPWSEQYPNSEPYWQSFNTLAPYAQQFLPDSSFAPSFPQNINQQLHVEAIQQSTTFAKAEDGGVEFPTKQKKIRAMQACETCRYRKQRCDEGFPCGYCKQNGLECNYRGIGPTKYLFPRVSLPSRRELTSMRYEKVVDLIATWMSAHSDGLSALAEKIDSFEALLQAAEKRQLRSQSTLQPSFIPRCPKDRNHRHRSHFNQRLTFPAVAQWPKVLQLLSETGIYFDEGYVMSVEDRPILRLRPDELTLGDVKHGASSPSENDNTSAHSTLPLLSTDMPITVDLGADTVRPLFDCFLEHIDTFYSFLDRGQMQTLFHHHIMKYSASKNGVDVGTGSAVTNLDQVSKPSLKRKRTASFNANPERSQVERSPHNALVLMALALGEIIMHQDPLPSTSDPLAPFTYSSGHEVLRLIPGIGYFAAAISIIGDLMDGHDLIHAQIFLLVGMYKAQLARVKEASTWYSLAGRVLTHLVQRRHLFDEGSLSLSTEESRHQSHHSIQPYRSSQDDLILRAAWACLQLEDDILPELRLPRSGLERLEDILLLPMPAARGTCIRQSKESEADGEELQRMIYTAQLQLRRSLQQSRRSRLSDESLLSSHSEIILSFKHDAAALQRWRTQLAPPLLWGDEDDPRPETSQARLQYLYWGAKLCLLRPFLYYVLHPATSDEKAGEDLKLLNPFNHLLAAIGHMSQTTGEEEIHRLAKLCVEAAKQSLKAFNSISRRLIVSNVQSIAHGQFSNTLMLAAAYQNQKLSSSVPLKELREDIDGTIAFLKDLSPISPTAAADCSILEGVRRAVLRSSQ